MLAMLDTLAKKEQHTAQVNWFHAAENGDVHAFADEVSELGRTLPRFTARYTVPRTDRADRQRVFDSEGLMVKQTGSRDQRSGNAQFYLCGPVGFMRLQNNWFPLA